MKHVLISFLLFTTVIFPTRIFSHHYSIIAHTISDSAREARSVSAADVDGDGDMDVLAGHNNISWYENDGSESFTTHTISTSAASSVYAVHSSAIHHFIFSNNYFFFMWNIYNWL